MLNWRKFCTFCSVIFCQYPRSLNCWEFEPKSGQADILDSNTQNNRVARLIFISKEYEQSIQYYSIAVSNHVWIHSANPLFNIQRNTLTVPTFSCVNKISLISMEYKNMSFHVYLTPPFSARNSIVLSFVWFQCNTLLTSIHLSIHHTYILLNKFGRC